MHVFQVARIYVVRRSRRGAASAAADVLMKNK